MNKVTSITVHTTAEGIRASITYSVINEQGKIIEDNKRINRVIVDEGALLAVQDLSNFVQGIADQE